MFARLPEPVRRDLSVSLALYVGLFAGELTAALVKHLRRPAAPDPAPAPEVDREPDPAQ